MGKTGQNGDVPTRPGGSDFIPLVMAARSNVQPPRRLTRRGQRKDAFREGLVTAIPVVTATVFTATAFRSIRPR